MLSLACWSHCFRVNAVRVLLNIIFSPVNVSWDRVCSQRTRHRGHRSRRWKSAIHVIIIRWLRVSPTWGSVKVWFIRAVSDSALGLCCLETCRLVGKKWGSKAEAGACQVAIRTAIWPSSARFCSLFHWPFSWEICIHCPTQGQK